jgi:hypothetical protein
MANEFVVKNGLISQNNSTITGSLTVSGSTNINGNTTITGSFTVVTGSAVELQVTNTGVRIGNIITDAHTVTGSLNISGSTNINGDVQLTGSMFSTGSRFTFRTTGTVDAVTITGSTGVYANSVMTINGLNQGNQNGLKIINLGAGDSGILLQPAAGGDLQFNANSFVQTNRNFTFSSINNAFDSSGISYIFTDRDKTNINQKTFLIRGSTNTFKSGSHFEIQKSGSVPILYLAGDVQSGSFSPNELYISGSLRVNSGNSVISGSFTVFTGSAVEFQVTNTGVKIGNAITDTHTVTGSLNISGSVTATNFTGSLQGTSSWANNAISSSYALTASYALTSGGGGGGGASFVGGTNVDNRIITATGTTPELNGEANLSFNGSILSVTGSVIANSFTGSLQGTSSWARNAISSSYAVTASYAATSQLTNNAYFAQGRLSGDQLISSMTDTIIEFVDQYDPQGWWDDTIYQFTPTIAGYYTVSLGVWFENPNDNTVQLNVQMRVNGNQEMIIQQPSTNISGVSLFGTKIVYLNGTTDYIDFTAYQGTANPVKIQQGGGNPSGTWFSATYMTM